MLEPRMVAARTQGLSFFAHGVADFCAVITPSSQGCLMMFIGRIMAQKKMLGKES